MLQGLGEVEVLSPGLRPARLPANAPVVLSSAMGLKCLIRFQLINNSQDKSQACKEHPVLSKCCAQSYCVCTPH